MAVTKSRDSCEYLYLVKQQITLIHKSICSLPNAAFFTYSIYLATVIHSPYRTDSSLTSTSSARDPPRAGGGTSGSRAPGRGNIQYLRRYNIQPNNTFPANRIPSDAYCAANFPTLNLHQVTQHEKALYRQQHNFTVSLPSATISMQHSNSTLP